MSETPNAFALPEGRLINGHLFVRSVYKDEKGREGKPKYNVEMAYPKDEKDDILDPFEDYLWDIMAEAYGETKVKEYEKKDWIRWPIKDGNKKAARREEKGKKGDAYKEMNVVSASSLYNKNGDEAEGGIDIYDEAVETIDPVNKTQVYNGCMGVIAVKAKAYDGTNDNDDPFISCVLYLEAFQMTGDADRLATQVDRSGLFQKRSQTAKDAEPKDKGRRSRG